MTQALGIREPSPEAGWSCEATVPRLGLLPPQERLA
jgi:hypothetical protein